MKYELIILASVRYEQQRIHAQMNAIHIFFRDFLSSVVHPHYTSHRIQKIYAHDCPPACGEAFFVCIFV